MEKIGQILTDGNKSEYPEIRRELKKRKVKWFERDIGGGRIFWFYKSEMRKLPSHLDSRGGNRFPQYLPCDEASGHGISNMEALLAIHPGKDVLHDFSKKGQYIQCLYAVTTIVPGWPSEISKRYGGKRTPVICTSLRRAKQIVENNEGDIFETTYGYAVIDKVLPNALYSFSGSAEEGYKEWWYEWEGTYKEGKYVPCSKPPEYSRIFGFSIG